MSEKIDKEIASYLASIDVQYRAALVQRDHSRPDGWECDAWEVSFTRKQESIRFPYYTGLGLRKKPGIPTTPAAAGVLYSLLSEARAADMSFPDWCGELGYDDDSRKAFDTYMQCCDIARELRAVFTRGELANLDNLVQEY